MRHKGGIRADSSTNAWKLKIVQIKIKHKFRVLSHALKSICFLSILFFRFTRLMSVAPLSQVPAAGQIINIHQLMVEVKKYKPNF